jgi:hypothetical protein
VNFLSYLGQPHWDYEQVIKAIDEKKLYNLDELLEYEKRKLKEIFN